MPRAIFIAAVQDRLSDAGLAPRLQWSPRAAGTGCAAPLIEYLPGQPGRTGQARELGRLLAAVHSCLGDLAPPGDGDLMRVPDDPCGHLARAVASHPGGEESSLELAALRWKLSRAERLDLAGIENLRALPHRAVHGDYHPGNVVFRGGRAVAAIDLDRACLFPRGYEVMRGLALCTGLGVRSPGRDLQGFLDAYAAGATLSLRERESMFDLYWIVQLADTHCLVPGDAALPPGRRRSFRAQRLGLLRWLECHGGELRRAIEETAWG